MDNQNNQSNQNDRSNRSTQSTRSNQSDQKEQHLFLPQHGHYKHLRVYQVTEVLYDLTYLFCKRFLSSYGDRTVDQMVQAARSGKQNIAEGNQAASTSSETEIKLTNVAKSSLEELLIDYEDFLRTRQLCQWDRKHPRFAAMRQWTRTDDFKKNGVLQAAKMNAEELANLCLTLCHQSIYMLTQLEKTQQNRFVTQGGIREQMHAARTGYRQGMDKEMEALRAENAALKQKVTELESIIQSSQNTQSNQSTPSDPSNQKNQY